jgi:hypothetical protein
MAGDWIKMSATLRTRPEVVRIMSACDADVCPHDVRVIGALHALWCWFDANSTNGFVPDARPEDVDFVVGWPGFASALMKVGWLASDDKGLSIPNFERHNGRSAKRRATENERKQSVRKMSARDADKKRPREEKRREENTPSSPPAGGTRRRSVSSGPVESGNPLVAEARESGHVAARLVEHFPSVNERAGWSRLQFDEIGAAVGKHGWDMAKFDRVMAKVRDGPRDPKYPTPTPQEVFKAIKQQAARDYAAQQGGTA